MASVNKVILIGNLGRDPELKSTQSGAAVCNFSIAATEKWKGKDGDWQESTEWHKITAWGKQAENCDKYLNKGSSVYVEGRLETRSWDGKDGEKKYSTDIVAQKVVFLGGGQGATRGHSPSSPSQHNESPGTPDDDDIPF